jgi:hypothetical protein
VSKILTAEVKTDSRDRRDRLRAVVDSEECACGEGCTVFASWSPRHLCEAVLHVMDAHRAEVKFDGAWDEKVDGKLLRWLNGLHAVAREWEA